MSHIESQLKRKKDLRIIYHEVRCIQMFVLVCRETGLDCDYIIKGETKEEFLENGAEHAIYQHGMNADDIYSDKIPVNFLCHSFSKVNR